MPSRPCVAAFPAVEVGREILEVDLVPGAVGGDLVQGQATILDDQDGVVVLGGEGRLDDAVRFAGGPGRKQQPRGGLTCLDVTGALPPAGEVVRAEVTAGGQITVPLAKPASESAGIGER